MSGAGTPLRLVVIMDPPETVLHDKDTSFALMLEAQTRGHRVDHCLARDLYLAGGRLFARVRRAKMQRVPERPIILEAPEDASLHEVDAILVRTDPPFDSDYVWCTLLLEHVRNDTLVVNDPRGLRDANEKLYACNFPELMPRTLVTSDQDRITRFVDEVGGSAVLKPLGGAGGEGVMALRSGDFNLNPIIEATTAHGKRLAMVQEFLPAVREGDKRVLVLEGEPLGALLRVPKSGEMRSNLHVGGSAVQASVTEADRRIVSELSARLLADGLYFVGIDLIGGKLTEVNVTSPTGIQQMARMDGVNYSARVIEWIERRIALAGELKKI
jgi:glutathione synthase